MKAAVVETFDRPPRYRDFDEPVAQEGEVIVTVRAAALSQLARAQAAGKHYSSPTPPFVPGTDGVGCLPDGQRVYFAFPRLPMGCMAERVPVLSAHTVLLPADVGDVTAAAIANPAMSSWAALVERAGFQPGESVMVNGAAGTSGRIAIQIARHLGAKHVIATARNPAVEAELRALGADRFIALDQPREALVEKFRESVNEGVDVVLDYLWGTSAEAFLASAGVHGGGKTARRIRFVNIGSLGGTTLTLPAASLRSSGVELVGSGLGSVPMPALIRSVAGLMQVCNAAGLRIDTEVVALADVEGAWARETSSRLVFTL